jgi:hypothetical protein
MTILGDTDLPRPAEPVSNTFAWPPSNSEAADDILWLEPQSAPAANDHSPAAVAKADDGAGVEAGQDASLDSDPGAGVTMFDLQSGRVSFEWHDVVALVQELGAQLKDANPSRDALTLDAITLEPDGQVSARLDAGTIPIARSLGQVLNQLLSDRPGPANLRLLALQAASDASTFASVEDLTSALAKFERPGRREALAALYGRARPAAPSVSPLPVPAKLERHAETPVPAIAPVPEIVLEPERPTHKRSPKLRSRLRMAALVVGVVATASIGSLLVMRGRSQRVSAPQAAVQRLLESVSKVDVVLPPSNNDLPGGDPNHISRPTAGSVRDTDSPIPIPGLGPAVVSSPPDGRGSVAQALPTGRQPWMAETPGSAEAQFRFARMLFERQQYAAAASAFERVISLLGNGELSASLSRLQWTANEMIDLSRAALASTPYLRVYTAVDQDVVEPVPLRQYFPADPGAARGAPSVLELIIDNRGDVESVRLRNPENRFRDKWWLPAAKSWRFKPALKDGQPVRFLKRITIATVDPTP